MYVKDNACIQNTWYFGDGLYKLEPLCVFLEKIHYAKYVLVQAICESFVYHAQIKYI